MYDVLIVGAGIAGSVVAREMAEKQKKVCVIDKRNHIGGNCYDEKDEYGVLIHPYGPHIFHTNVEEVFAYLSRYTKWNSFYHTVVANVHGEYMPVPFNLHTLEKSFGAEAQRIEKKLIDRYGVDSKVPILELMSQKDSDLKRLGHYVYDNIYVYYTMKQWGKKPEEIDPAVTARVPVSVSYNDGYFSDFYQGLPKDGYTEMFKNLLNHENITTKLNVEAKTVLKIAGGEVFFDGEPFDGEVIFTGPIDEFFDCKYGRLPYRTLRFSFEHYEEKNFQNYSVVNYTVDEDYTRITEYKCLTGQECKGTTISKEYPSAYEGKDGQVPYYAIASTENAALYEKYKAELKDISRFHLLGRLSEYQYYNIDKMVEKALALSEELG